MVACERLYQILNTNYLSFIAVKKKNFSKSVSLTFHLYFDK